MNNRTRPKINQGVYQHIYQRSFDGADIFTNSLDALFFITVFKKYSVIHKVNTIAFCLMDNHIHALCRSDNPSSLSSFIRDYSSVFVGGYNKFHNRRGRLFQTPFGSAPKKWGKKLRTCITYINNNPVEAGKETYMEQYIWNLFAYSLSSSPFSDKIVLKRASCRLRRSLSEVSAYAKTFQILFPRHLQCLMDKLSKEEKEQLRDYILKTYTPVDYSKIISIFGSIDQAVLAMHSFMGNEYDIKM